MWEETKNKCETNCQCLELITDSFRINSGNNATKRRHEEAVSQHNYRYKMNPLSLNLDKPSSPTLNHKVSPLTAPRRVLGEIQNSPLAKILKQSPLIERTIPQLNLQNSPVTTKRTNYTKITKIFEERISYKMSNKENREVYQRESFMQVDEEDGDTTDSVLEDPPFNSPVNRGIKRSRTINNWTTAKLSPASSMATPTKLLEDSSRDSGYSNSAQKIDTYLEEQSLDFSDIIASTSFPRYETAVASTSFSGFRKSETIASETVPLVPETQEVDDADLESEALHDLEREFESDNFDECSKYEIISTDSPNIISRGRSERKISSKNFVFGAPIADTETSTSFNRPNVNATRMLNFDEDSFEFPSPRQLPKTQNLAVKKSLKFSSLSENSPVKVVPISRDVSDSSIGSLMSSPSTTRSSGTLFPSNSTHSIESGFVSEIDDVVLDIEEASNSPKLTNFTDLLSGQIKTTVTNETSRRPVLNRSVSYNVEKRVKTCLFSTILEGQREKRVLEVSEEDCETKRQRSSCEVQQKKRPTLQRAYSENAATIMTALARSASNPDLIGDFSLPFALPLTSGSHSDLKSISCSTLAALIDGEFSHSIADYQVIDCRYPYEYSGGHIRGASNLYTPEHILGLMARPVQTAVNAKRSVLVFHCEFSLERGPKLSRFLRSTDRAANRENYPSLHYPEVYLLHEGYRTFHRAYPRLCDPPGYTAMLDPAHKGDLRALRGSGSTTGPSGGRRGSRARLLL